MKTPEVANKLQRKAINANTRELSMDKARTEVGDRRKGSFPVFRFCLRKRQHSNLFTRVEHNLGHVFWDLAHAISSYTSTQYVSSNCFHLVRKSLPLEIVDKSFGPSFHPWSRRLPIIDKKEWTILSRNGARPGEKIFEDKIKTMSNAPVTIPIQLMTSNGVM
ncbi:unnamed protein product [Allacma fusca]|uniref:Uncharacterized protein n=1 Tax=Allacma fusca TaxID=39272 RepID=A0A8J2LAR5_9HEXA|nr:unnamed protein product [Allacma fusca]